MAGVSSVTVFVSATGVGGVLINGSTKIWIVAVAQTGGVAPVHAV